MLGVLTALLAEQAVQSIEWHQKVDAAVADMDNELSRGDGPQSYARLAMHDCIATRLNKLRAVVERGDRADSRKLIDAFWLPKRTWDSLAREEATASDVASHMPHARMLNIGLPTKWFLTCSGWRTRSLRIWPSTRSSRERRTDRHH